MRLDHFVIHTSNSEQLLQDLKGTIEPMGFPFEPKWGKGSKGFKVSNIWVGQEYFEIVRLLDPVNNDWVPRWANEFNQGARGIFCLFIETQKMDTLKQALQGRGVNALGPERTRFKILLGLFSKKMPWRYLTTPPIPGTSFEIGFIEYDPGVREKFKDYMVPNSERNGILGIESADVMVPHLESNLTFLKNIFPDINRQQNKWVVPLGKHLLSFREATSERLHVRLYATTTNAERKGRRFQVENVEVIV
jgi:hypothetical protein